MHDKNDQSHQKWAFLDADETLWKTTFLYDLASEKVAQMIVRAGDNLNFDQVLSWIDEHDVELTRKIGYSMHRFPQTLRDSVLHFLGGCELEYTALGVGYNVYLEKTIVRDDCLSFLVKLKEQGFKTCVITAGEHAVQNKRLQEFEGLHLLDEIKIVLAKNKDILKAIVQELDADINLSFMIGDSLRSDVVPASEIGLTAIYLNVYNWSAWEIAEHNLPDKAITVQTLTQALDFLPEDIELNINQAPLLLV